MDGLLEVLRVDYGSDLSGGIRRPIGRHYLHLALAGVHPVYKWVLPLSNLQSYNANWVKCHCELSNWIVWRVHSEFLIFQVTGCQKLSVTCRSPSSGCCGSSAWGCVRGRRTRVVACFSRRHRRPDPVLDRSADPARPVLSSVFFCGPASLSVRNRADSCRIPRTSFSSVPCSRLWIILCDLWKFRVCVCDVM